MGMSTPNRSLINDTDNDNKSFQSYQISAAENKVWGGLGSD